ncbi:MAG TPA: SDR family oxidoreductase [Steroidobacteraceae bacterium]|nr:SDR family oxidoreductase [Steroidobacteraceae bacterium]
MAYFVTGATGFIGRHLVAQLCARGEPVYVLVRPLSRHRLESLVRRSGEAGKWIRPLEGDLAAELLGLSAEDRARIRGSVSHFVHLGALYDLAADAPQLERANVTGTRNALALAADLRAGCFHFMSSIAVAGLYPGTFTEDMFSEAQALEHPYFRTKHAAELLVRSSCRTPWRIYRPSMVVGDSRSGAMDKVDGPYYLFKAIQRLRDALPRWVPLIGFEGGYINLVPVDFVASALDHLMHVPGQDGRCFHLTDPLDRRIGEVLNLFAGAAHAPTMSLRLEPTLVDSLSSAVRIPAEALQVLARVGAGLLRDLGIPRAAVELLNYPTRFDAQRAQALLASAGIRVPPLEQYAWRLWDYWERELDPRLHAARDLGSAVSGRSVLITGGSSGVGRATALRLAAAGARVLIVARDPQKLDAVRAEIASRGGEVHTYSCDITDGESCERVLARILTEHPHVDILINNAGRSIRRGIDRTYDRFHDYERVMRLNYFGAVRVTLALLPSMVAQGAGHVINISSIGVLSSATRFASYNASKAALEAFSRCAAGEYATRNVHFTVVNLPLVRTPMVAPTRLYEAFPLIEADEAAERICTAIIHRPDRVSTPLGSLAQLVELIAPALNRAFMSESFKLFPDSEAAGGAPSGETANAAEVRALASLMRGVHC